MASNLHPVQIATLVIVILILLCWIAVITATFLLVPPLISELQSDLQNQLNESGTRFATVLSKELRRQGSVSTTRVSAAEFDPESNDGT